MMSSSAEVDSFRFLRGGRGRDEEASLSPSRSESEEKRKTDPLTWLCLMPFDLLSRSLSDLDFLFFRRALDRGTSMSFIGNIQINAPLMENQTFQGQNTDTVQTPLVCKTLRETAPQYPNKFDQCIRSRVTMSYPTSEIFYRKHNTVSSQ